jgi:hypothetical protein
MSVAPWQLEIWKRLVARAGQGGLPHVLLLSGPPGIGKRAFAERLASFLLCDDRSCTVRALPLVSAVRRSRAARPGRDAS